MRWNGRSVVIALTALQFVATALPCGGAESFTSPNPKAPEAVPYKRSLVAPTPAKGDAATGGGDADRAAERELPAPASSDNGADVVEPND